MFDGVIVMGMHRSGTSMTAGILRQMGVNLGDDLISADSNNRAGYFESNEIVRNNAKILHSLDRRWTGPKGTLEINLDFLDSEIKAQTRHNIKQEIRKLSNSGEVWGIKDPRISRLLPFWHEILNDLDVRVLFILCVRHPLEVAESIARRDGLPQHQGQLLWLKHNEDAMVNSKTENMHVVIFNRWFTDFDSQVVQLNRMLNLVQQEGEGGYLERLKSFIRPELRHHSQGKSEYLPYINELYRLLVVASETGSIPPRTWDLLQEVAKSEALFSTWSNVIRDQVVDTRLAEISSRENRGLILKLLAKFTP